MARRDRPRPRPGIRDPRSAPRGDGRGDSRSGSPRRPVVPDVPDPQGRLDRLTLALLPLRVFLGATFLYAGLDKLIDPTFLRSSGAGSIASQLDGFVRVSPVAPLIQIFAQPFPVAVGLLIAVVEIAIGLGALTGLLFRVSATGGAALSILFWLTASWSTTPYYYGPDLPYAAGWLTLALAGHGGRFALDSWFAERLYLVDPDFGPPSPERRRLLEGGILGATAIVVAWLGGTFGGSVFGHQRAGIATGSPAPGSGDGASPGPSGDGAGSSQPPSTSPVAAGPTPAPGDVIGRTAQVTAARALAFTDPRTGDPGLVVKLPDGSLVAFDAICPHAGCTVEFDPGSRFLVCPCHGAAFDPTRDAAVVQGPARQPLSALPIRVDKQTGTISLAG
jgi:thiosulfate dehydrogenase [quinone] large subunit